MKLKLFDLLGQEVATIAEGTMASGEHRISYSPDHLSSSIYFARLETSSQSRIQKLVILK